MGLIFTPSLAILGGWFTTRRAFANGLAAAGSGVGALMFSLVTRASTARLGIKYALIINGGICAVVLFPAILLLKSRAKQVEARFEIWDPKLLRNPGFLCLVVWGALCGASRVVRGVADLTGLGYVIVSAELIRAPISPAVNRTAVDTATLHQRAEQRRSSTRSYRTRRSALACRKRTARRCKRSSPSARSSADRSAASCSTASVGSTSAPSAAS